MGGICRVASYVGKQPARAGGDNAEGHFYLVGIQPQQLGRGGSGPQGAVDRHTVKAAPSQVGTVGRYFGVDLDAQHVGFDHRLAGSPQLLAQRHGYGHEYAAGVASVSGPVLRFLSGGQPVVEVHVVGQDAVGEGRHGRRGCESPGPNGRFGVAAGFPGVGDHRLAGGLYAAHQCDADGIKKQVFGPAHRHGRKVTERRVLDKMSKVGGNTHSSSIG